MKVFDKKDVITCVNAEDAKKYIGKLGYFANGLIGFDAIDHFAAYSLDDVQLGIDKPFFYREQNFALFLPEDKVKEIEEPKWRAFKSIKEFADTLGIENEFLIGKSITWRAKDKHSRQGVSLITNIASLSENEIFITLGSQTYIIGRLFTDLEWLDKDGNWRVFGVKE